MPATLQEWLDYALLQYERHHLAMGQITWDPHDEALYLMCRALGIPLDSPPSVLEKKLSRSENERISRILAKRIHQRIPAAYLTHEAFLNGHRFYVDERVLIPRSYFLEHIPQNIPLPPGKVSRAADICTGSGCLAILLAYSYPGAHVDAVDISPDALEVAAINIRRHRMAGRVHPIKSDVLESLPPCRYDLIISNPPYEPSALCSKLPPEFKKEPRLALDGGGDGLDIIRKLLAKAPGYLTPQGLLLIEVGGLQKAMEKAFPRLPLRWLPSEDKTDCVCLIRAEDLPAEN